MVAVLFPGHAFAAPAISFAETAYDAGIRSPGERVEHVFEFTNTGSDDLVIERVAGT